MGKSPGKWFKDLIRGKKSSKSKEKDVMKIGNAEPLVSSKFPSSNLVENLPTLSISHPIPVPVLGAGPVQRVVNSDHAATAELRDEKANVMCGKDGDGSPETSLDQAAEIVRLEDSVTEPPMDVTGGQAAREFDKDRSIVRLQAVIRGHLVRKQAVATLNSSWAIVKFQALVRGQKVRRSSLGIEVQGTVNLHKLMATYAAAASGHHRGTLADQNFENAFIRKLLTSTPSAMPLALQYSSGEPNSAMEWMNRWTRSRFWERISQQKMDPESNSLTKQKSLEKAEAQQSRQKKTTARKSSSPNIANGVHGKTLEPNKPKHTPRKLPETAPTKVKHASKKASGSTTEVVEKVEAVGVKPKRNAKKIVTPSAVQLPEQDNRISADVAPSSEVKDAEEHVQTAEVNGVLTNVQENNILQLGGNDSKTSQRRASLPANVDQQENGGLGTPKLLPSYMTPTQSAKAKLRGQGSTLPQDAIEKNGTTTTRRHSLPASINEKCVSMSPRAYRQVHSGSKGFMRSDRSLTSSRDGSVSDRMLRPEWRR